MKTEKPHTMVVKKTILSGGMHVKEQTEEEKPIPEDQIIKKLPKWACFVHHQAYPCEGFLHDEIKCTSKKAIFTIGQRNSIKLIYDGYCYTKSYLANNTIKWVCSTKNYTKCRARLRFRRDMCVSPINTVHNHSRKKAGYRNIVKCTPELTKSLFKDTIQEERYHMTIEVDSDEN
uniref:FLYWCH-type domain-containing protein n=1 Tax=Lutzomyia longipalpis TaxID=7200 RepID=A0A1B0GHA1_LUTLO